MVESETMNHIVQIKHELGEVRITRLESTDTLTYKEKEDTFSEYGPETCI